MPKYRVQTGELDSVVIADSHETAVAIALRRALSQATDDEPPPSLGVIVDIIEVVENEPVYWSTEEAMKLAGIPLHKGPTHA